MKTIKVSKATRPQLDWLMARSLGVYASTPVPLDKGCVPFMPTTSWHQMGPIIFDEKINLETIWNTRGCGIRTSVNCYKATHPKNHGGLIRFSGYGEDYLIAAARCLVLSRFGEDVDVPDELVEDVG